MSTVTLSQDFIHFQDRKYLSLQKARAKKLCIDWENEPPAG